MHNELLKPLDWKLIGSSALLIGLAGVANAQTCTPTGWDTSLGWGYSGVTFSEHIDAMIEYDDGTGPALYAAGRFLQIGGTIASSIARFDPQTKSWHALEGGITDFSGFSPGTVYDMEVFDFDGPGPEPAKLVVAGEFGAADTGMVQAKQVATWDGTEWGTLGTGITQAFPGFSQPEVRALEVYDDGSGPRLYAGGIFRVNFRDSLAVWNGSSWQPVDNGLPGAFVFDLKVYDDGTGEKLYIGGSMVEFGNLVSWDGSSMTTNIGGGTSATINEFEIWDDDGAGANSPSLFAFGQGELRRWDGSSLTSTFIYSGFRTEGLCVYDDGSGPALYMGPNNAEVSAITRLYKWDGSTVTQLPGDGLRSNIGDVAAVYDLFAFDSGNGTELWTGGYFVGSDSVQSNGIIKWDGSTWKSTTPTNGLGQDMTQFRGADRPSFATSSVVFDPDGAGPMPESLYVSGSFETAGGNVARNTARWDGNSWSEVGGGLFGQLFDSLTNPTTTGQVRELVLFDDGTGLTIYANAVLQQQEQVDPFDINEQYAVFKLDLGTDTWVQVGGDFGHTSTTNSSSAAISDLAVYDDGSGPALYAAGHFTATDAGPANHLAKWNGTQWVEVGGGVTGTSTFIDIVLEVFDDGTGERLFVGGGFNNAGGTSSNKMAIWDGTTLFDASSNLNMPSFFRLATAQTDNGPILVAGSAVQGLSSLKQWNGTTQSWSSLAGTTPPFEESYVIRTGSGTTSDRIWVQAFDYEVSFLGSALYSYDGQEWSQYPDLGLLGFGGISQFTSWNGGGTGPALWLTGSFSGVQGSVVGGPFSALDVLASTAGIIPLLCEAPPCPADMNDDGVLDFFDVQAFLGLFSANDPAADFNNDSVFDFFDVQAFLQAFADGCP